MALTYILQSVRAPGFPQMAKLGFEEGFAPVPRCLQLWASRSPAVSPGSPWLCYGLAHALLLEVSSYSKTGCVFPLFLFHPVLILFFPLIADCSGRSQSFPVVRSVELA